jgi:hypothetical protein
MMNERAERQHCRMHESDSEEKHRTMSSQNYIQYINSILFRSFVFHEFQVKLEPTVAGSFAQTETTQTWPSKDVTIKVRLSRLKSLFLTETDLKMLYQYSQ